MSTTDKTTVIAKATIARMGMYLRCLLSLQQQGVKTLSSRELAEMMSVTSEQVRRDLASFGRFGKRGSGYDVDRLRLEVEAIFGKGSRRWKCCIVGVGSLGTALLASRNIHKWGFRYVAAFDNDPAKVGTRIERVPVYAIEDLKAVVRKEQIAIGVIAVPGPSARAIARSLHEAGIRGILNFAPQVIREPEKTPVLAVDLSQEFLKLSFYIQRAEEKAEREEDEINASSHVE
ncbi:MAG: redox-sensing transcriptional repressor Rex [Caldisericota bacterium]|jgi:redox-sensing transcriptional repressor|nr:redox-sensing transcriptional repressor Rex [Caldisericota bacterium]